MPLHIIRNDLVNMDCDAIVNTANPHPQIGAGTDSAVFAAAGEKRLMAARQKIGEIEPGMAAVTGGYALKARYIIHTVGPVWEGGDNGEEMILRSCYRTSLRIAEAKRCKSVAFPLISTGSYGYPKEAALKTAVEEIRSYLEHSNITVYLVVFGKEAYELSGKYSDAVEAFIDEHYVKAQLEKEYSGLVTGNFRGSDRRRRDNLRAEEVAESELSESLKAEMSAEIDEESMWEPESAYSDMSDYMDAPQSAAPGFGMPQPAVPKSAEPGASTSGTAQQPAMPRPAISEPAAPESSTSGPAPQNSFPQADMYEYGSSMSATPKSAAKPKPRFSFMTSVSADKKKKKLEQAAPVGKKKLEQAVPVGKEKLTQAAPVGKKKLEEASLARKKKKKLEDSDIVLAETFSETLLRLIDEKEMTDVEVYKRANIDRKLFSKIRSRRDYQPGKKTALALAVALKLDLDQTKDLLSRAGYAISPSSKFDLIVEFFIVNEVYDIDTINIALFDHQEQTLG